MYILVVEHDNGIKGQRGFSDDTVNSLEEVNGIIKSYESHGITVYNFTVSKLD